MSSIASGTTTTTGLIYTSDTTGNLVLQTNGTTTAVTIDTNQNVGIGTSSPSTYGTGITVYSTTGGLNLTDGTGKNGVTAQGNTLFLRADTAGTSGDMRFYVNGNTERARIDSSGNLGVGNSSAVGKLEIYQNSNSVVAAYVRQDGTANIQNWTVAAGATKAYILTNGGLGNYSANNVNLSDATMKKDITPAKSYLSIINQIPVVTFLFNDQTDTQTNLGVTAQSVQAVAPELVGTMDVGTVETPNVKLAIYETDLKYAMLKAIQELSAEVTALKAKVGV